jgi:hypothetical protein
MSKIKILSSIFTCISCFIYIATSGQVITTFAGSDTSGYGGDGGPATSAAFNTPLCTFADAAGNIYIADWGNNRVRKVNTSGIITTVAGNGTTVHGGDGGPATAAGIVAPYGIVTDAAGNLYITEGGIDTFGQYVRKVSASGVITTIAGSGTTGYSGDGGPATAAQFSDVRGIAVDGAGNVYVADAGNFCIRKINTTGIIATIAGNDTSGYSGDGGPATAAELSLPTGLALDGAGNIYLSDYSNNRIRKIDNTGIITTIAGNDTMSFGGDNGPATAAELHFPAGLAIDGSGNLYIADENNSRVRKVNSANIITTIAGNGIYGYGGDGGHATAAELSAPAGVTVDGAGNIYIADADANNVRKVIPYNVGVTSIPPSGMNQPHTDIWPDPNDGNFTVYIPSALNEQAQIIITSITGQRIKEIVTTTNKKTEVQLNGLPGLYFITIVSGGESQSARVITR